MVVTFLNATRQLWTRLLILSTQKPVLTSWYSVVVYIKHSGARPTGRHITGIRLVRPLVQDARLTEGQSRNDSGVTPSYSGVSRSLIGDTPERLRLHSTATLLRSDAESLQG